MPPVRFGLIACSEVARRRFLPALRSSKLARLEHTGSRDAAKAAQYAQEFGASKHGDYAAVLADPAVDAVYVSTPPPLHGEWVLQAAAAGKHVLCEKPAFRNMREARAATAACQASGVFLMEGYMFAYHPQHAAVASWLAEGRIGGPRFFQSQFTYPRPRDTDIRLNPALEGGVLHDSVGYPVAAALRQLPGEPVSVSCQLGCDPATGVDDSCALWLRFSTGAEAQIFVAFGLHYRSRYAIHGPLGRIEATRAFAVPPDQPTTLLLETATGSEQREIPPADQFGRMIDTFAASLTDQAAARQQAQELLRRHAVLDAAARSHREKRTVALSECD
ncbi:MAG: Gfo/Idh/MocA family oxidoreductase [Opitutae bacterium]|nr:Gfo/Idh/MocA family oxidoreductase [Opitutae bacterium]